LYSEAIAIHNENNMKHVNKLCWQNA